MEEEKEFCCENCEAELDGDDLEWLNDQPLCPHCDSLIDL